MRATEEPAEEWAIQLRLKRVETAFRAVVPGGHDPECSLDDCWIL
jgi:hypothetical protein